MKKLMLGLPLLVAPLAALALMGDPAKVSNGRNYVGDYPALTGDGEVQVVVEIPAGSHQKWEVLKDGSAIEWEWRDGQRRVVRFLPYPAN